MRQTLSLILVSLTLSCHAAGMDGMTRLLVKGASQTQAWSRTDNDSTATPYYPLLLQLDSGDTAARLQESGVLIYNHRHDIYLTSVPRELLDTILDSEGVIYAASMCGVNTMMDVARGFVSADMVEASAYPGISKYDGTGVVVGFSDIGFDASHIAFAGKVKGIHQYDTSNGTVTHAMTDSDITGYTTDDADKCHATHVGNILTGHYKGNDYYGIATGSDLVATTSRLYDSGILAGVEDIIEYAKSRQQPVVINLSLGTSVGPHDGTDLMSRYLSYCAEDAVICVSAGNNGNYKVYAGQNLSEAEASVRILSTTSKGSMEIYGYTDIWGDSSHPFEICIGVYDLDAKETVYKAPWVNDLDEYEMSGESDPEFGRYFTGTVKAAGELSQLNGRYNVGLLVDVKSEATSDNGPYTKYMIYLGVRQPSDYDGEINVDIYANSSEVLLDKIAGSATTPGTEASISNMACADGVISIGMATSRIEAPNLNGEPFTWEQPLNHISRYSSYNTSPRVKRLPHISAPGYQVISATSGHYMAGHPDMKVSAMSAVDGREYYWHPESGTSMSSPLVAGIFATWLQADPSLTSERILQIACATAKRDYEDIGDPRWGAGCIDAYAGLREVIRQAGIIDACIPQAINVNDDGYLNLHGLDPDLVHVYTAAGIEVSPIRQLTSGIYIVRYGTQPAQKIRVR